MTRVPFPVAALRDGRSEENSAVMGAIAGDVIGSITDKGYTNQRAVITRRAAEVERVYNSVSDERTIEFRLTV